MTTGNLPEKAFSKPESPAENTPIKIPDTPEQSFGVPEQRTDTNQTEQQPIIPEQGREILPTPEQQGQTEPTKETIDSTIDALKRKLKLKKKKNTIIPRVKDELTMRIEKVMEEGLADAYRELSPVQQQEFKIKGEETAWEIRQLLKTTRVKIKEIFKLLLEWLKMLPGINRFFLEQEAKIKADKILSIKNYRQEK